MEWDQFWRVIDGAYRADGPDHLAALTAGLDRLTWLEVVAFQARFDEAVAAADTPDLRAAAALVQGGWADAGFRDFRVWLVARGQDVYDAALLDPDTLAAVLDGDPADGFGLDAAAVRVYEAKTGMSDFFAVLGGLRPLRDRPPAGGADLDFATDAELRTRFPKLNDRYPALPAEESDAD